MRAFEKLVCGRSRAAEIANMGASIAGDRRRLGNCVWGLSQKWEGGLVFEKLVYGSMESSRNTESNSFWQKKVLGCKVGT